MASSNLCELIRIANNASYFTDEHCDNMTAEEFDVLICGSGSAGLCAAIWLARYGRAASHRTGRRRAVSHCRDL